MDRLLAEYSYDASGALTRSLDDATTSGFIRDDAAHWSIESFIPINAFALAEYLVGRGELTDADESRFRDFCSEVDKILQERSGAYQSQFSAAYWSLDPDADTRDPLDADHNGGDVEGGEIEGGDVEGGDVEGGDSEPREAAASGSSRDASTGPPSPECLPADPSDSQVEQVVSVCETMLEAAGYREIGRQDIEQCVGVASQWGVPLHVDLGLFQQLVVFARGDIIGTRLRRRLRKLYRRESVAVPIYQRMIVIFRLRDDDGSEEKLTASALHLRMFKNIPKQDIDMLLPGTRVRISGVDRVKIVLPSLGGFLMSIRKLAQYAILFAAFFTLHWGVILAVILVGYLIKSVLSYFQTKSRYQLSLTRNLYFQKLDANAGVGLSLVQQAHQQSSVEMILAYYAMLTSSEAISQRRLRRRCERMVREAIDVEVDFQVDRSLTALETMNAASRIADKWKLKR